MFYRPYLLENQFKYFDSITEACMCIDFFVQGKIKKKKKKA